MTEKGKIRAIISGGGTGGHIFPALSIADRLKEMNPETEILFVGAEGRMEMEKVPAAGYGIEALPICGLQRKLSLSNLKLPFKVLRSISMARRLIRRFKPDICIGVGGYASAPLLWAAQRMGVPTLIQEQNGFAGLTNRILGRRADCICVAYPGMERFFPAEKIVMSGNPIRKSIIPADKAMREEGLKHYSLDPSKRHILIVGGSLGCRTLNNAVMDWVREGCPGGGDIELLWQCGKAYLSQVAEFMARAGEENPDGALRNIRYSDFIGKGYLKEALINYLALVGWNPGDDREFFTMDELVEAFDIHRLNNAPGIFDVNKLTWFNAHYIAQMDFDKYLEQATPWFDKVLAGKNIDYRRLAELMQSRTEVFNRIPDMVAFLAVLPDYELSLFENKKQKSSLETAKEVLPLCLDLLKALPEWTENAIHDAIMAKIPEWGKKNGTVLWALRIAISGQMSTPGGAFEIAYLLGRDETIARIYPNDPAPLLKFAKCVESMGDRKLAKTACERAKLLLSAQKRRK